MFGGSNSSSSGADESKTDRNSPSPPILKAQAASPTAIRTAELALTGEKLSGNGSPSSPKDVVTEKKRRSSSVSSKASSLLASAKNSLSFSPSSRGSTEMIANTPIQKLGKKDHALVVPQGKHNNAAGDSLHGPKSTFKVGVWEDKNKKCRRTMEDTHAFLYNFLETPTPGSKPDDIAADLDNDGVAQSDNGYFSIFDGHAGTFAADWCGKKLHIILEDLIRKNPTKSIPELLDNSFTVADKHLESLPVKNSGTTAAVAVLRWEHRIMNGQLSSTTSLPKVKATDKADDTENDDKTPTESSKDAADSKTDSTDETSHGPSRQRLLYTANVGDARIVLCRNGKALRLSYDHKGSDENEGKRITSAGGLILNNRVNGVLAVTRALGDSYMKDLVTGHPYTTETVIQPDLDEFIIIACDGIWDVCSDQAAVDLIRNVQDPTLASKKLVDHALNRFSTDNLSCMIVRFDKDATAKSAVSKIEPAAGVRKISEVDRIVNETKMRIAAGTIQPIGVSATNGGRGYEPDFIPEEEWETDEEERPTSKEDDDGLGLVLEEEEGTPSTIAASAVTDDESNPAAKE